MRFGRIQQLVLAGLWLGGCAQPRPVEPWQAIAVPTDADYAGVWFTDSLNGWLTGSGWSIDGGIVGRTRDGGRSWRFQTGVIPFGERGVGLGRVQFRDSLHGVAAGGRDDMFVTDDGGTSWRAARVSGWDGTLFDVQFIDATNGWAGGSRIVRTSDGGETWRTLVRSESENGYLSANALCFVSATRGWLVSHGGTLQRSEDGGETWSPVPLPLPKGSQPTLRDVAFQGLQYGWVVGENGTILNTSDGGATWKLQSNGVPAERVPRRGDPPRPKEVVPELETPPDRLALMTVAFADAKRGWAVGYYADVAESVVLGTEDGGENWHTEHVQQGELLRSLFVLDREHAWAAGDRSRTAPHVVLRLSH